MLSEQSLNDQEERHIFVSTGVMFNWQNHKFLSYFLNFHTVRIAGRGMCGGVVTLLSFLWCLSHSSVSSAMIMQPHESQSPIADEKQFYFSLSYVFILVICSYVYRNKQNTKTHSDAWELDHFTATFLEESLSQYQPEVLALLWQSPGSGVKMGQKPLPKGRFGG